MIGFISIHAPAKGATSLKERLTASDTDFNPRSREGSDVSSDYLLDLNPISIHAPAKGATRTIFVRYHSVSISIHAPAKGATRTIFVRYHSVSISIHAPAKGATSRLAS